MLYSNYILSAPLYYYYFKYLQLAYFKFMYFVTLFDEKWTFLFFLGVKKKFSCFSVILISQL